MDKTEERELTPIEVLELIRLADVVTLLEHGAPIVLTFQNPDRNELPN